MSMKPNFSALFDLLDRVLSRFDKERAARRRREELRKKAEEIVKRHTEALQRGNLRRLDQEELASIMRIEDLDERNRRLVEFDKKTRYR